MSWTYSEQNIVQEPAAKMMEAVGWTSVLAYDAETFGPNGMLGRADKSETVLWRSVRAALKRINGDWITDAQVEEAIEKLKTVEHGKSLMQLNSEAYEFVRDGVKVTDEEFGETGEAERRAKLIDFDDPTGLQEAVPQGQGRIRQELQGLSCRDSRAVPLQRDAGLLERQRDAHRGARE